MLLWGCLGHDLHHALKDLNAIAVEQSQIVKVDAPMYACKVALYCPKCDKGVRSHIEVVDGKKVRVCAKCGYKFD